MGIPKISSYVIFPLKLFTCTASSTDGTPLSSLSIMHHEQNPNGQLRQVTIDFPDQTVPDSLMINCSLSGWKAGELVVAGQNVADYQEPNGSSFAQFQFLLEFAPSYTAQGETIVSGKEFMLDGNRYTLDSTVIYPTFSLFQFTEDPDNPGWLTGLTFYVENEDGKRFKGIRNGIRSSGNGNSPSMLKQRLESSYFASSNNDCRTGNQKEQDSNHYPVPLCLGRIQRT